MILNVGAGKSLSIENQLDGDANSYIYDRVDVEDCTVEHPRVQNCYNCSVESMDPVDNNKYIFSL